MGFLVSKALFYPKDLTQSSLRSLVRGTTEPVALDTVEFEQENGGEAIRQLALPRLPGMDEVEIDLAQMRIQSISRPIEITDFTTQPGPGQQGVFLSLAATGRLLKVEVEYSVAAPPPANLHVVVRAVKKNGSGLQAGVPLFADPDFPPPGDMFPSALTGMLKTSLGANRYLLTLPSVMGDAWLIQLASGDKVVELKPIATQITIHRVTLDAVPSNVAVVLVTAAAEVPLWGNPQMLLPSDGLQEITFTPLAQKELSAALKAAGDNELTLPLTIKFRSATAGALGIYSKALQGRYVVRPLSQTPASLRLAGSPVPLRLSAPAGLKPQSTTFRIVAKLKGWELNQASAEPPATTPSGGLRVTQANRVAQGVQFAGGQFPLVNVRLRLASRSAGEVILELHEDASGGPAALVGKPIVRQLEAGIQDWIDFELKEPLAFAADSTPLWITLRVTKGEVLWFASAALAQTLISTDEGASWGAPDAGLAPVTGLLAQLFHDLSPQFARPVIRVERSNVPLAEDLMQNARPLSPREYVAESFAMPSSVLAFFPQQSGAARVEQTLQLFSTSILDLRVESASFFYDPFQPGAFIG
ncbi:MAG: hypothetical protein V7641_2803 [Blastocatellia bacterium]